MSETLVTNTSPLIFLSYVDGIDWLTRLSATSTIVAHAVVDEVEVGDGGKELATAIRHNKSIAVMPNIAISRGIAAWDLGSGESQVLAYCHHERVCRAVLDDKAARDCARSLGIPVIGTLGIVLTAKQRGWISSVRPVIEQMLTRNLYLAPDLVRAALAEVGE